MKGNKEEESETSLNNRSIKLAHRRKNIYKFGNGTSLQMRTNIFKKCKKKMCIIMNHLLEKKYFTNSP